MNILDVSSRNHQSNSWEIGRGAFKATQKSLQRNSSNVESIILLNDECLQSIIHELIHTLGFAHEHQRHDKDKYIDVDMNNVPRKQV